MIALTGCVNKSEDYPLPDVSEGNEFEITLEAHGGTAYQWSYELDSPGIEYVSMEFIPQNEEPDRTGGGQVAYTFKAVKAGDYKIQFELSIPWESESPVESRTYKIKVVAE